MNKKILIVGAGTAGLSAGIHALRNGYEAEIYEQHHLPGGLCTAWERKGYTFDGCIHWLTGSKPGSQFNRLWAEVCDIGEIEMIDRDCFMTVEGAGGREVSIFNDLERLENALLEQAPADAAVIKEMCAAAIKLSAMEFPLEKPAELIKLWDMPVMLAKSMPMFKLMGKFARVTIEEYLAQLKDDFLRQALSLMMPTGYSMISLLSTLASHHAGDAGFPKGGSLNFARSLEKKYKELGGAVFYNSPVKEIDVVNNRAKGLLLSDGQKIEGDLVISAADLYQSIFHLLKGKYVTPLIKESFNNLPTYSSVQVSFGVAADLAAEKNSLAVRLENPVTLGESKNDYLYLTNYAFDSTLAPKGKSVIVCTLNSSYDYWAKTAKNRELYRQRKEDLADQVFKVVNQKFPLTANQLEATDVATPHTYHRYTGVYQGAYMGWIVPPANGRFRIPNKLPDLENYYQIGQWVEPPAGLPGSMLTGRQVIQIICKSDKKTFRRG